VNKALPSTLGGKPWYKEFWPWFIITLLGTVVTASLITVAIAFRHADDLVVDDYYKVGLAINQRLEHREAAMRLGIDIEVLITPEQIRLLTNNISPATKLELLLTHPIEADRDFSVDLSPGPDGVFFAALQTSITSGWHWSVSASEPEPWLISGTVESTVSEHGSH
jgi:hypothetical protein